MNKAEILKNYLIAALWAEELDNRYIEEISLSSKEQAIKDIDLFISKAETDLIASKLSDEQIWHDFWLTRNHHGTGFWGRDLDEIGERLTNVYETFITLNVFGEDVDEIIIE